MPPMELGGKFKEIFEVIPDPVYILDLNGNILEVNSAAEKTTGYSEEELLEMNVRQLLSDYDPKKVDERLKQVMEDGYAVVELKRERKDGTCYYAEVHARLIDYESKKAIFCVERDITKRKELEDRLKLYREIFTNSNDGIAIIDADGNYVEQNQAHRELLGYSDDELKGKTPAIHMGEEQFSKIYEEISKKGWYRGEIKCYRKDGSPIYVELSAFALKDDKGDVICYVGIKRDITQRKKLEEELRKNEEKYRLIVENSRDIIVTVDENGIRTYVSPSVESVLGYKPEDLVGKPVFEQVHPDDLDAVRAEFFRAVETKRPGKIVHRYRRKDGKWIWLESKGSPMFINDSFVGGVIIARDVTERIELEMKLRESEAKYRETAELLQRMIDVAPAAIIGWDLNFRVNLWNKTAEKMFEWKAEEVMGRDLIELMISESERERVREVIEEVMKTGESKINVNENIAKNGRKLMVEWYNFAIKDAEGKTVGAASIGVDLTERIEMERKIRESEEKFRKIFENSPYSIAILDKDGVFVEANPATIKSIGKDPVGKSLFELFPKEVAERRMELLTKVLDEDRLVTTEDVRDGRYFSVSLVPVDLPDGKYCLILAKEITDLVRLNRLLNAIYNINKLIVHEKDKQKLLERASEELASLEDYSIATLCLVKDGAIIPVAVSVGGDEILDNLLRKHRECEIIKKAIESKSITIRDGGICVGCGLTGIKSVISIPMVVDGEVKGVITLYLTTSREISDDELELLGTMAEDLAFAIKAIELDEMKRKAYRQIEQNIEQFAILVDHIRNPLAAIILLAELEIKDRKLSELIIQQAERIEDIIKRLDKGWLESEKVREFLRKYG
ncbi:PAS domain S-box [Archaeoglobus sulfaticallidus PM70-1]|uniref:PAS domain S-box n=2 Tax=Archaeoglobus TaxID=2233 RepID=N0BP86_9EURY|nr:PAS domain S-box [Archaeoglobus sulfaticallidus PM70-1]